MCGWEGRSLGAVGGVMGQETCHHHTVGKGQAAAGWGSLQDRPLYETGKNFSPCHTQRLQFPPIPPT